MMVILILPLFLVAIVVEFLAARRVPGWNPFTPVVLLIPYILWLFWRMWVYSLPDGYGQQSNHGSPGGFAAGLAVTQLVGNTDREPCGHVPSPA
jgi:hypothetical protein